MLRRAAFIPVLTAVLGIALAAQAQTTPQTTPAERAREAAAMLYAAGFQLRGHDIVNPCGRTVRPKPVPVDLNGDGRPEAVIVDVDPACYGGTGEAITIIQREGTARWTRVGAVHGRFKLLESRTNGWRDYTVEGPGCQPTWTFQPGQGYVSLQPCPGDGGARPAAATPPPAAPADRAAAFRAAGFSPTRGKYLACDPRAELGIEIRDLNGDGRPDAVITNSGLECFGNTGQGFVLVTKDAGGAWKKLYESQGIPDFQATRGVGGWPDIVNGGPGFCFPVKRWNGQDYAIIRWKEEQRGACAGRR